MKFISTYIDEKLKVSSNGIANKKKQLKYFPDNEKELNRIIAEKIKDEGYACDLNDIDTSQITNMAFLFSGIPEIECNVSEWDVSNVTHFNGMFNRCYKFDCDLSNWDVSNAEEMCTMFKNCSKFKGLGLENWKMPKCRDFTETFSRCRLFDCNVENWDMGNAKYIEEMFTHCEHFKGKGLEKWNVKNIVLASAAFSYCVSLDGTLCNNWGKYQWTTINDKIVGMFYLCDELPNWKIDKI